MEVLKVLVSNYYINVGMIAWLTAQVLKTLLTLFVTKEFVPERLVGAGGMPSAHSALVVSLAVSIERKVGFSSPEFAIAIAFAAVVMYDAMGVRRAAGEQAKVLNKIIDSMSWNIGEMFTPEKKRRLKKIFLRWHKNHKYNLEEQEELENLEKQEKLDEKIIKKNSEDKKALLKEFLGHTPIEVFAGAILGAIVASVMPVI